MACVGDSSDTDQDIGPMKTHSSSKKRFISSSEDESHLQHRNVTPSPLSAKNRKLNACTDSQRHSQRKRKQSFQMPSREEQWNSIPTGLTASTKLSRLQPRKLINDFTRVTHRYNYDYLEVSGEESMDDFIKSTDSSDSSEADSTEGKDRKNRSGTE